MPSFNEIAVRLYRRFFGTLGAGIEVTEANSVLTGEAAIAYTEAAIADAAALADNAGSGSAGLVWQQELQRRDGNLFGHSRLTTDSESPRSALAAAIGLSISGQRATTFLDSSDLASAQDLLSNAVGRHLPLVIHLNNQALPAQGATRGSGHHALHLAAESGCFTLFATNVQEAADFTLIARRIAEEALIPGLVVVDGDRTGRSAQELLLPSPGLIHHFLGASDEAIDTPSAAQQILFGDRRPRVPCWHDLDHPMLQGSLQSPLGYALGSAGATPYFADHLEPIQRAAFERFGQLTGRHYHPFSSYHTDGASLVLLAQGAAVETARAAADYLKKHHKLKTGVIGLQALRPFPGGTLTEKLAGVKNLLLLERLETPQAGDPPLMRELRAAFGRARENGRYADLIHSGYPALDERKCPSLHSAIYGIGGLELSGDDLVACATGLKAAAPSHSYLGLDFHYRTSSHPKRQVLLDRILRAYPEIAGRGLKAKEQTVDLRPPKALTLRFHHRPYQGSEALASETGVMLQRLEGGHIRTLNDNGWSDWASWACDLLHHLPADAPGSSGDPGDSTPVNIAIVSNLSGGSDLNPCQGLADGGVLLLGGIDQERPLWPQLAPETRQAVTGRGIRLFGLPTYGGGGEGYTNPELSHAHLLGGLLTLLNSQQLIDQSKRGLLAAWESGIQHLPEEQQRPLIAAFEAGIDALLPLETHPGEEDTNPAPWSDEAPLAVRSLGGSEATIDSLPRFWDQIGILHRDGEQKSLTADPFMATAAVPPLTSTFRDMSRSSDCLPQFSPERCSACGACWSICPDSAIGVAAVTPANLVNALIALVGANAVRPVASKLAARISAQGRSGELTGGLAGEWLNSAWRWLQEKAPLPDERKEAIQQGIDKLLESAGELPLTVTRILFERGEKEQKDGGALLSLVINPDSCKGCGLCSRVCPEEALTNRPVEQQEAERQRGVWRLWQQTPDTESHLIERATVNGDLDPMAALLMSRYCALAMAGGDGAEAGSGEKIALRLALAATEYQQQPLLYRFSQQIGEAGKQINELIRQTLAEALPTDDLTDLAARLNKVQERQVALAELTEKGAGRGIDAKRLNRLIELNRKLKDAHWRLTEGRQGLGRARYGLAIAPGSVALWAGAFPNNPFQAPVTLDMSGNAAQMAIGLLQGQLSDTLALLQLYHQAQAELDPKLEAPHHLQWQQLTEEERRLCPPLILVGSEQELGGRESAQVSCLLNSGLPLKVLVLSELDLGLDSRGIAATPLASRRDARTNLGLMALAQRDAYVAQTSIATPGHLRQSMREALNFTGPALIRLHAPSPSRHGFASHDTLAQASRAVDGRAFPLFRYQPEGEGVFGSRITLDGNPQSERIWADDERLEPLTPLAWAIGEQRFSGHFSILTAGASAPLTAEAWLALAADRRPGKTPYIELTEGEESIRYQVSEPMMAAVEEAGRVWSTLQELAGVVTPFTAQVNRDAEARVAQERQAELAAQKADYEARLLALEAELKGAVSDQIKHRLLNLAGYQ